MFLDKIAHVRGMTHRLIQLGLISFKNEKIGEDVSDLVAENQEEDVLPSEIGEEGLTAEQAAAVIDQLAEVAELVAEKVGSDGGNELRKLASNYSLEEAAQAHAWALVKRAMESGSTNPGQGPAEPELTGSEAQIDAINNPSSEVVGPKGATSLDATPGAVGHQELAEQQPGTVDVSAPASMADVKAASELIAVLQKLSKDGTLPQGGGRQDLNTNAEITQPVVPQGTTNNTTPTEPVPQKAHPATEEAGLDTTSGTQADVSKVAAFMKTPTGRAFLEHLKNL